MVLWELSKSWNFLYFSVSLWLVWKTVVFSMVIMYSDDLYFPANPYF